MFVPWVLPNVKSPGTSGRTGPSIVGPVLVHAWYGMLWRVPRVRAGCMHMRCECIWVGHWPWQPRVSTLQRRSPGPQRDCQYMEHGPNPAWYVCMRMHMNAPALSCKIWSRLRVFQNAFASLFTLSRHSWSVLVHMCVALRLPCPGVGRFDIDLTLRIVTSDAQE